MAEEVRTGKRMMRILRFDPVEGIRMLSEEGKYDLGLPMGHMGPEERNNFSDCYYQEVKAAPDYPLLRKCLSMCVHTHSDCQIENAQHVRRNIYVIDVLSRALIRLGEQSEYLALSYLWGNVYQPTVPGPGPIPQKLPLTIEHAMIVAKELGYQYLWVDSVCINQTNAAEKAEQIQNMGNIYADAVATIVVLGGNADSGIPGVDRKVFPRKDCQYYAHYGNNQFLSKMPSLKEDIASSEWSNRGWTYQEGILSPRKVLFSENQAFFFCNQGHMAESFNAPKEHIQHNRGDIWALSNLRDMGTPPEDHFQIWNKTIGAYASRILTHEEDALNAVAGILQKLTTAFFPDGFLYGLPLADFRHALLWGQDYSNPTSKHGACRRVEKFPSWTWAGWRFGTAVLLIDNNLSRDVCLPPLKITYQGTKINPDQFQCVSQAKPSEESFPNSSKRALKSTGFDSFSRMTHLFTSALEDHLDTTISMDIRMIPKGFLQIQGLVLRLPILLMNDEGVVANSCVRLCPIRSIFNEQVGRIKKGAKRIAINGYVDLKSSLDKTAHYIDALGTKRYFYDCLFLSADRVSSRSSTLQLLLLDFEDGGVATRAGRCYVAVETVSAMEELWPIARPTLRTFWLA
ncbi:HET-domain-containing protein [Amniculicola lignicola CBS 123094]|uniref:HET-domain-containing protein n=1 Tax=Amniculicola lignicola CBS 123094 TaxID=1392246 RepID=A0A6A5WQ62_9PLEO|nr:HET-domain-containing protein [Amniculicola lignicola CBS 123094]